MTAPWLLVEVSMFPSCEKDSLWFYISLPTSCHPFAIKSRKKKNKPYGVLLSLADFWRQHLRVMNGLCFALALN